VIHSVRYHCTHSGTEFICRFSDLLTRNRDTSVSIVTRLQAGRPGLDSQQMQWWAFFSVRHRIQTGSGAHLASYSVRTGGYFPRG